MVGHAQRQTREAVNQKIRQTLRTNNYKQIKRKKERKPTDEDLRTRN